MRELPNFEKRGRPDITHNSLLNALGSPLNKSGNMKLYIHTTNEKIFNINPDLRIARNYNRFKGLMAKLLIDGQIKVENTFLIKQLNINLVNLIKSIKKSHVLLFSRIGKPLENYYDLFKKDLSANYIAVIGGFQKNRFSQKILDITKNVISISNYSLDAWVAVNKVISYYEIIHDIK